MACTMFTLVGFSGIEIRQPDNRRSRIFSREARFRSVVVVCGGKLRSQQEGGLLEEKNGGFAFTALLRLASSEGFLHRLSQAFSARRQGFGLDCFLEDE